MRTSDLSSDVCSSDLEQDSSIRQARAQLAAKRAALDLANEQLARYRPLAATGAEPREKLQQYETQAQQAHADFVAAQAAVSAANGRRATLFKQIDQTEAQAEDRKSTRLNSSH